MDTHIRDNTGFCVIDRWRQQLPSPQPLELLETLQQGQQLITEGYVEAIVRCLGGTNEPAEVRLALIRGFSDARRLKDWLPFDDLDRYCKANSFGVVGIRHGLVGLQRIIKSGSSTRIVICHRAVVSAPPASAGNRKRIAYARGEKHPRLRAIPESGLSYRHLFIVREL